MVPIKSNHHQNHYPPLDHAEMKSQPFKLHFLTAIVAVHSSFFYLQPTSTSSTHVLHPSPIDKFHWFL
ncbi:hypothetical protein Hanom_Chr05g00436751 [Helianthus anomalus]